MSEPHLKNPRRDAHTGRFLRAKVIDIGHRGGRPRDPRAPRGERRDAPPRPSATAPPRSPHAPDGPGQEGQVITLTKIGSMYSFDHILSPRRCYNRGFLNNSRV